MARTPLPSFVELMQSLGLTDERRATGPFSHSRSSSLSSTTSSSSYADDELGSPRRRHNTHPAGKYLLVPSHHERIYYGKELDTEPSIQLRGKGRYSPYGVSSVRFLTFYAPTYSDMFSFRYADSSKGEHAISRRRGGVRQTGAGMLISSVSMFCICREGDNNAPVRLPLPLPFIPPWTPSSLNAQLGHLVLHDLKDPCDEGRSLGSTPISRP